MSCSVATLAAFCPPVVALDAPGIREVVVDQVNGRLLHSETVEAFSSALQWAVSLPRERMQQLKRAAKDTAKAFSIERSTGKALALYDNLREKEFVRRHDQYSLWTAARRLIKTEWGFVKGMAGAALNVHEREVQTGP